jgi:orotidine-5'-phosphate decarboxylase
VLGLDPDPMALWPGTHVKDSGSVAERSAASVFAHCRALIDAAGPACVAVKPQLARFEALGAPGWRALEEVVAYAHEASLLVIADAKRGDIDVTALAYSRALMGTLDTPFGPVRGLGADMVTVNPLMGTDALEPFVSTAREVGAGLLVLVRTSNPSAADIEDLQVEGGGAVWERIASLVATLGDDGVGESGLSDIGAVVGATVPAHLARPRLRSRASGRARYRLSLDRRRVSRRRGDPRSGWGGACRGRASARSRMETQVVLIPLPVPSASLWGARATAVPAPPLAGRSR